MISLEERLAKGKASGKKLLVPYITGGVRDDWLDIVQACADAGADAIEIGFPFSDPVMDGPVIQAASEVALKRGATTSSLFSELGAVSFSVPLAVMTYVNLVYRFGFREFAEGMKKAGISGAILPDLPKEESEKWFEAAREFDVQPVLLVAPNTPDDRLVTITSQSRGFVYAIGTMGVTGERSQLAVTAASLGDRARAVSKLPVLIGIGISNADQAREAAQHADGVIVGSAVIRRILDGNSPAEIGAFIGELRAGLDSL